VAGYFVDIGVRHHEWPHGFILGVECDGASYHSAKSARDRDRLRQEVLEGLGWRLHRVWSTDWFNNPQREVEKLRAVISSRMDELKRRETEYRPAASRQPEKFQASQAREAIILPLFSEEKLPPPREAPASQPQKAVKNGRAIGVGDTVQVRYLTGDQKTLQIMITRSKSDPSQGIVNYETPVAKALLGAEEGDVVEVLVGSYVKPAVVERIIESALAS
jgi:hypothetical protein